MQSRSVGSRLQKALDIVGNKEKREIEIFSKTHSCEFAICFTDLALISRKVGIFHQYVISAKSNEDSPISGLVSTSLHTLIIFIDYIDFLIWALWDMDDVFRATTILVDLLSIVRNTRRLYGHKIVLV